MGNQLRVVFRNFPLTQIHPHSEHAAEAAESAGGQGMFWEMHDTLYEHQNALDDLHLVEYAAEIGLDLPRFERDMAMHTYADRVREDFMSGVRSGVNGTPTFFINGRRHDGSYDLVSLMSALEKAGAMRAR
jgi:protein-disulfide isomerase